MAYCSSMKRPCSCGRLTTYSRNGRTPPVDNTMQCLTDEEIKDALTALNQEILRRSGTSSNGMGRAVHCVA